jgi:hypothetical protein
MKRLGGFYMFTQMLHQKKKWAGVVVCGALFFIGAVSLAAPITVPTDLNPGDPYVLAFVSSTVRDATSSNIGDYNDFVQGLAETAGIGQAQELTWKAIASTATVDARDNVGNFGNVPVYLLDGTTVIADSFSDLWDGSLDASLDIDEKGMVSGFRDVWTGSEADGTGYSDRWLGSLVSQRGRNDLFLSNGWWISAGFSSSSAVSYGLYGLSAPLTVPTAIPEPSTLILLLAGLLGVSFFGYGRKRRQSAEL